MQHMRRLAGFIALLLLPIAYAAPVFAGQLSASREITVSATVPKRRAVVLDARGEIAKITSNTPEDVAPDVYEGSVAPENRREPTEQIMKDYRYHVPVGTAKYGVLYENNIVAILLSVRKNQIFDQPLT